MSKKLKRVPLDFQWEILKVWQGYINPHTVHECENCAGTGCSSDYRELEKKWYSFANAKYEQNPFRRNARYNVNAWKNNISQEDVDALIQGDRLWDFTRVALNEAQREIIRKKTESWGNNWLPFNNGYLPTAAEVNKWNLEGVGHDSINKVIIIKARLKKQGLSYKCEHCSGSGVCFENEEAAKIYNDWQPYEPPKGEGYQLWNDEHPLTPVFPTLELLCEHCEIEKTSVFAGNTASRSEWKTMLENNFLHHKDSGGIFSYNKTMQFTQEEIKYMQFRAVFGYKPLYPEKFWEQTKEALSQPKTPKEFAGKFGTMVNIPVEIINSDFDYAIYVFNMEKKELKMQIPQKYVERLNDLFEKPLQIVFENE